VADAFLSHSHHDREMARCLKGTKRTSDAATRAKNSGFLPLFNRLRRGAGLAPTAPDVPF
jgi:hypothetical protein